MQVVIAGLNHIVIALLTPHANLEEQMLLAEGSPLFLVLAICHWMNGCEYCFLDFSRQVSMQMAGLQGCSQAQLCYTIFLMGSRSSLKAFARSTTGEISISFTALKHSLLCALCSLLTCAHATAETEICLDSWALCAFLNTIQKYLCMEIMACCNSFCSLKDKRKAKAVPD